MCRTNNLHHLLASLPKCEHHIHLEGALTPSTLFALSRANSISLPDPSVDPAFTSPETLLERYNNFTSLTDFLHYYYIGMSVLITSSDYERLAYEYFVKANEDGVVHAEVFFDPQAHTSRGVKYETVVAGFKTAQERALKDFGITSLLTMCFMRDAPVSEAEDLFEHALSLGHFSPSVTITSTDSEGNTTTETKRPIIAGIGLDSSELGFPPELFEGIYAEAAKHNLHRTAHAGEEGGPSYISGALDFLGAERIDHGVRLAASPELTSRVASSHTLLTICPISNAQLKVVKEIKELPIRHFLEAGVRFSLNSDDPAYFGGFILENWCAVQDAFQFTVEEWKRIVRGMVEGSWCDEGRKEEIWGRAEKVFGDFESGKLTNGVEKAEGKEQEQEHEKQQEKEQEPEKQDLLAEQGEDDDDDERRPKRGLSLSSLLRSLCRLRV